MTIVVLSNSDNDAELAAVIDILLDVVLESDGGAFAGASLALEPVGQPPEDVSIVQAFSNQKLFCERDLAWEVSAGPEDWTYISLDWVVSADETLARDTWSRDAHWITDS